MEQADRVEWNNVVIRTGDSALGQQQVPACFACQASQHPNAFKWYSSICLWDFPAQIKYIKDGWMGLLHFLAFPFCASLSTHSLVFLCTHFNLTKQLFLSETIDSFRYVSFFLAASLLPQHPPSFSKVFLFRETIAPRDIVRQAGRQTEQVFFCFSPPPFLLLSLTFY